MTTDPARKRIAARIQQTIEQIEGRQPRTAYWETPDRWLFVYSTERMGDGRFSSAIYRPHRDRSGQVTSWHVTREVHHRTRRAAKARAYRLYQQHKEQPRTPRCATKQTSTTSDQQTGVRPMTTETAATTKKCPGVASIGRPAHEAPLAEFGRNAAHKDGLTRLCKACDSAYTKARAAAKKQGGNGGGSTAPGEPQPVQPQ
jgi:hypothetical protein